LVNREAWDAGGAGVGAGKLLVKGATLLKATSGSKTIVKVASAATEGGVSATTSAGLKGEPSDGALVPAAAVAVGARGLGGVARRYFPKAPFSRADFQRFESNWDSLGARMVVDKGAGKEASLYAQSPVC
jgi:hypothetical protein